MTAPLPVTDGKVIKPAQLDYKAKLEIAGRAIDMTISRSITAVSEGGRDLWKAQDEATLPMGKSSDTVYFDRVTLRPVKRILGGFATGNFTYSDKAVKGKMSVMGRDTDIDVELDAPILADGPGVVMTVAGLPLADGYEATIRQLNNQSQKVEAYKLKVTGKETTKVAAGSFPTYILEMTPLGDATGGGVMRVMQSAPHYVVKGDYKLPASMGGGTMNTELTKVQ